MFSHPTTPVQLGATSAGAPRASTGTGDRRRRPPSGQRPKGRRSILAPAVAAALAGVVAAASAAVAAPTTAPAWAGEAGASIRVALGASIQAAIDAAPPGSVIRLAPGTYREQLVITADGTQLIGPGATLVPPAHPHATPCDPTPDSPLAPFPGARLPVGVCVIGRLGAHGEVRRPVADVRIDGIAVDGFGMGVLAVGTTRLAVLRASTRNNTGFGATVVASTGTVLRGTEAASNGDTGLLLLGDAGVDAVHDRSLDNHAEGLLLLNSTDATVSGSEFRGNCSGVSVVALGAPSGEARISGNRVATNNTLCPRSDVNPQFAGIGVLLAGASHVVVAGNLITGNTFDGEVDLPTGGVVVVTTAGFGGGPSTDDRVVGNVLRANTPDLVTDGTGARIAFVRNRCTTSSPDGLC